MDERQEQRVNEAAQKFAEALTESYRAVSDRTVSAREINASLMQSFFNDVISNLRGQAERNREMTQELANQQQRQQEATRTLAQESVNAYMDFVNSAFSYYQGNVEQVQQQAEQAQREVAEDGSDGASGSAGTTSRSEAPSQEQQAGDEPLMEDYDSLNVNQITENLDDLSEEQIRQLRAYEVRHKNRRTLMERLNERVAPDPS